MLASYVLNVVLLAAAAPPPDAVSLAQRRTPVVEVYENVRDSVVNISSTVRMRRLGGLFDLFMEYPQTATSLGSGFVIHEDGYVVTNWHVVGSSTSHKVTFANGREFEADVLAWDETNDIAVLKIRGGGAFKAMTLGRSDDLMIGETAIAIGNPFGFQNTVTTGVVSALHRELEFGGRAEYKDLIQTDASINHGNSGGPLINILGQVIGINTAIRADAQNIGFAIPVDRLRAVLPDVLDIEKLHDVQIGLRVAGDTPSVVEVRGDSPADRAGVRLGDRLVSVNGTPVRRDVDFYIALLGHTAGDRVALALQREGKPATATLELAPMPKPDGVELARAHLGVTIQNPSPGALRKYGIRDSQGVIITAIEPRSPADRADLRPGDLITRVGRYLVTDADHMGQLLKEAQSGDPVDIGGLRFHRNDLYQIRGRLYAR